MMNQIGVGSKQPQPILRYCPEVGRAWKKERVPMFREGRHQAHFTGSPETRNWKTEMLCKRWLEIYEEVAYRKMLSCTNKMTVKDMGKFLIRVHCKWERK
jgi:hypothetical protein